jgi:hypothetical protein
LLGETFRRALTLRGGEHELERLGEICQKNRDGGTRPLYKALQEEMPLFWQSYFDEPFKLSGYLPLYDLVVAVYRAFDVWVTFKDEEASLTKILEVIKEFEGDGRNSVRDFLASAESDEEGEADWNVKAPQDIDAVRVMTVHKAKGLGFPVVILLLYEEKNRGFRYILEDTEEGVRVLRLNKDIAASDESLGTVYREKESRFLVDRLNSLYVAFTRARAELYVVGVYGKAGYPLDLLLPYRDRCFGGKCEVAADFGPLPVSTATLHGRALSVAAAPAEAGATFLPLSVEEKERGEIIHRVLSVIEFVDEALEATIDAALARWGGDFAPLLRKMVLSAVLSKDLSEYFLPKPGRVIKTEQEYADRRGNLVRMDRVVIDEEMVTVIDFKTGLGSGLEGINRSPVRNYVRIAEEIYPGRPAQGLIAYLDHGRVEKALLGTGQD